MADVIKDAVGTRIGALPGRDCNVLMFAQLTLNERAGTVNKVDISDAAVGALGACPLTMSEKTTTRCLLSLAYLVHGMFVPAAMAQAAQTAVQGGGDLARAVQPANLADSRKIKVRDVFDLRDENFAFFWRLARSAFSMQAAEISNIARYGPQFRVLLSRMVVAVRRDSARDAVQFAAVEVDKFHFRVRVALLFDRGR